MIVLGVNAFHGDASSALVIDGEVVSAVEEERLRRIKHWAGFPSRSIEWCLSSNKLQLSDIDLIAVNQDNRANVLPRLTYLIKKRPDPRLILEKLRTRRARVSIESELELSFPGSHFVGAIRYVEHHRAHLASAYYPSGFERAWAVSVDGFGDFASTAWGLGDGSGLETTDRVLFPHSLGVFYQAFTQWLGFPNYGDEYKVMGLSPYGKPLFVEQLKDVVLLNDDGHFRLDLEYFTHHREDVMFEWEGGAPVIGALFSAALCERFGPARLPDEPLTQYHKDIASSVQSMYELAFFHLLNHLHTTSPEPNLALAGGCAMNSVANGKITLQTPFENIYVQAAAGDAGGAVGAALAVSSDASLKDFGHMRHAYLGPSYTLTQIEETLGKNDASLQGIKIEKVSDEELLCSEVAKKIAEGKVIGWFQGSVEWGPRALGHRSILGDPRRADMKEILNAKIKRRESFRPFAPSVMREHIDAWFEQDAEVPFMTHVFQIREDKRSLIPAVTHVDGSGRLQSVTAAENGRYYSLIKAFFETSEVPMLLNTSFNENEPIVCSPAEALDCFLRTNMDVLVLEDYVLERL